MKGHREARVQTLEPGPWVQEVRARGHGTRLVRRLTTRQRQALVLQRCIGFGLQKKPIFSQCHQLLWQWEHLLHNAQSSIRHSEEVKLSWHIGFPKEPSRQHSRFGRYIRNRQKSLKTLAEPAGLAGACRKKTASAAACVTTWHYCRCSLRCVSWWTSGTWHTRHSRHVTSVVNVAWDSIRYLSLKLLSWESSGTSSGRGPYFGQGWSWQHCWLTQSPTQDFNPT